MTDLSPKIRLKNRPTARASDSAPAFGVPALAGLPFVDPLLDRSSEMPNPFSDFFTFFHVFSRSSTIIFREETLLVLILRPSSRLCSKHIKHTSNTPRNTVENTLISQQNTQKHAKTRLFFSSPNPAPSLPAKQSPPVAQTSSLLYRRLPALPACATSSTRRSHFSIEHRPQSGRPADWKSAIQQVGNLRYPETASLRVNSWHPNFIRSPIFHN
jgi:hypothetical protein